jgi:hypothetical protein
MNEKTAHLGEKISLEMKRLGLKPKDLAAHFKMKPPSITELLQTGRLAKERYPALVALNGRSLDWWFDIDEPGSEINFLRVDSEISRDLQGSYAVNDPGRIDEHHMLSMYRTLPKSEQDRIAGEIKEKADYYQRLFLEMLDKHPGRHK